MTLGDAAPESRYVIFSSTKPVVAGAVWILMGEGRLDVSRRVAEIIPEFATNGKDAITIEQVLLHTSGFPSAPFGPIEWDDRERRLERFASWRCNWEPGTRYEYHPTSAHWVLAELIERCTGSDFRDFVRTRVIEPLGLSGLQVGVPVAQQGDINDLVATGSPATPDELEAVLGIRELPVTEVTTESLLTFNEPAVRAVGVPGGGGVSTAADLALFYQALLHDPVAMWKPEVLADVTSTVRNSFPDYMGVPANRTRGLVVKVTTSARTCAAWVAPFRRGRSGTTAPAVRSRGVTPRPGCRSAISRTASTSTSCASGGAAPRSRTEPGTVSGDVPASPAR